MLNNDRIIMHITSFLLHFEKLNKFKIIIKKIKYQLCNIGIMV